MLGKKNVLAVAWLIPGSRYGTSNGTSIDLHVMIHHCLPVRFANTGRIVMYCIFQKGKAVPCAHLCPKSGLMAEVWIDVDPESTGQKFASQYFLCAFASGTTQVLIWTVCYLFFPLISPSHTLLCVVSECGFTVFCKPAVTPR